MLSDALDTISKMGGDTGYMYANKGMVYAGACKAVDTTTWGADVCLKAAVEGGYSYECGGFPLWLLEHSAAGRRPDDVLEFSLGNYFRYPDSDKYIHFDLPITIAPVIDGDPTVFMPPDVVAFVEAAGAGSFSKLPTGECISLTGDGSSLYVTCVGPDVVIQTSYPQRCLFKPVYIGAEFFAAMAKYNKKIGVVTLHAIETVVDRVAKTRTVYDGVKLVCSNTALTAKYVAPAKFFKVSDEVIGRRKKTEISLSELLLHKSLNTQHRASIELLGKRIPKTVTLIEGVEGLAIEFNCTQITFRKA